MKKFKFWFAKFFSGRFGHLPFLPSFLRRGRGGFLTALSAPIPLEFSRQSLSHGPDDSADNMKFLKKKKITGVARDAINIYQYRPISMCDIY